jgi:probable F420-dependent oxidoreductase
MKIGLQLYLGGEAASPEFLDRVAPAIEERGFHEIWLAEHIILPQEIGSPYPYSADGSFPYDPSLIPLDPFTALTYVAAKTDRIRLATGISVLPQRNPILTAKQVAEIDLLSRGRFDYGIGAGWCLEEIEILGTPSPRRGARTDDYVRAMQQIWTQDVVQYDGEFVTIPPSYCNPKPLQRPHPPLYFGGISRAAMRRVARLGQGWFAVGMDANEFASAQMQLQEICAEENRTLKEISVAVGPPDGKAGMALIEAYRRAGAEQVILALTGRNIDRFLSRLDDLAEHVVEPASKLT